MCISATRRVSVAARAKVNLGLHVLRRQTSGYHEIRTIYAQIDWFDHLWFELAPEIIMTSTDRSLPVDDRNLCVRAARSLAHAAKVRRGALIYLEKRIPSGAGLGGGSSDAATTLRSLNELWGLHLSMAELSVVAAGIGSDVPFFLAAPIAVGEGRGERLSPLRASLNTSYDFPFWLCVIVPSVRISTALAYDLITPRAERGLPSGPAYLEEVVLSNDLERWRRELVNDFEEPVMARYPEIANVKTMLLEAGAGYASLSGSGSAVYGVFEDEAAANAAAEAGRLAGLTVWTGRASTD